MSWSNKIERELTLCWLCMVMLGLMVFATAIFTICLHGEIRKLQVQAQEISEGTHEGQGD